MSNAVFADGETHHNGNDPDFVNGDYCGHVLTAMTDYYERIANREPYDVARRKLLDTINHRPHRFCLQGDIREIRMQRQVL